jgi:hypothetical protein
MDGLLIDSEDIYLNITNTILAEYDKPNLPWKIKAKMQGRPGPEVSILTNQRMIFPGPASVGIMCMTRKWTTNHIHLYRPVKYFLTGLSCPSLDRNFWRSKPLFRKSTFLCQSLSPG